MRFKNIYLAIFLIGCSENNISTSSINSTQNIKYPVWYGNLEKHSDEIIGYGNGENEREARDSAIRDISEQIHIKIKTTNHKIQKFNKNDTNSTVEIFEINSRQNSSADLKNLEIVKRSDNGKFIAIKYRKISFEELFLEKLNKLNYKNHENIFINNTKLGILAKSKNINLPKLYFFTSNNETFIRGDEVSEILPNFKNLFFKLNNQNIKIFIPETIKELESFDIKLDINISGFLTLLNINEQGEVFEIISNYFIKNSQKNISVNKILEQELYGVIDNNQNFEESLFIAILSKTNLENKFNEIRNEKVKYSKIEFQNFLKLFDNDLYLDFSTNILLILK